MKKGNFPHLGRQRGLDHKLTGAQLWSVSLIAIISLTVVGFGVFVVGDLYFHPNLSQLSQIESLTRFAFAAPVFIGAVIGLVVAFRRQHVLEASHGLSKSQHFTSRFESCARLLSDPLGEVRAAGIYSLIQLADDWEQQRQVCISLLCSHVRQVSDPENADNYTPISSIMEEMRSRLGPNGIWQGLHFDLTGVALSQCNLSGIFLGPGTILDFTDARITSKAMISVQDIVIDGGVLSFRGCRLWGGLFDLSGMTVKCGEFDMRYLKMFGGVLVLDRLDLKGGNIQFWDTECENSQILARNCQFCGGLIEFGPSRFEGVAQLHFERSKFLAGIVDISNSGSSTGHVFLDDCEFASGVQPILWLTPPRTELFVGLPTNLPNAVKFANRRLMSYKEVVPGSNERPPVGMWIIEENPNG